ncbi:MAG: sucrose phosphorylase [Anaerolineae bacterium]
MTSFINEVQLITYPDSLGGDLATLDEMLSGPLSGLFGGIHVLPFFPSSGDRGFSPITYQEVDPQFGNWEDIRRLGARFDLIADFMVNHISRRSPYFQDFARHGRQSPYADMFITLDKVWPSGEPRSEDVKRIFLRRPEHPFADITISDTGATERVWATFGGGVGIVGEPEQIDLDVTSPVAKQFIKDTLRHLGEQRIRIVRLDAVGYVVKKAGTSCFFVEPEIYDVLEELQTYATSLGITLLPEVHAHHTVQASLAAHDYVVYDFVLPLLVLHTLFTHSSSKLQAYLRACPRDQLTMLDCHDGIPVQPDLDGILTTSESQAVVDRLLQRGANLSRLHAWEKRDGGFDAHQVNITYYSALDGDDDAYLAARAIQLFAPGVPQVYYVGLLAGENDIEGMAKAGERRAINRHNYSVPEIEAGVEKPVVQRLFHLIRFRNSHRAFHGTFTMRETPEDRLTLAWTSDDAACTLDVDLNTHHAQITHHEPGAPQSSFSL